MPTRFNFFRNPAKPTFQRTDKLASIADGSKPLLGSRGNSGLNQPTATPSIELTGEIEPSTCSSQNVDVSLRLEGPYFTLADPSRYKTVICIVAGTGVSGAIAIARAFLEQKRQQMAALEIGSEWASNGRPATASIWERCVIIWSVRTEAYIDLPYIQGEQPISMAHRIVLHRYLLCLADPTTSLEVQVHLTGKGRPRLDIQERLGSIRGQSSIGPIWVYLSGPSPFIISGEDACKTTPGVEWYSAKEI